MKKTIILVLVVLLLMSSFASAGVWDWLTGKVADNQIGADNTVQKTSLFGKFFGKKTDVKNTAGQGSDSPVVGKPATVSSGDKPGQKLVAKEAENGCILVCPSGSLAGSNSAASALQGTSANEPKQATADNSAAGTGEKTPVGEKTLVGEQGEKTLVGEKTPVTGQVTKDVGNCMQACNDKFKTRTQVDLKPSDVCAKEMQDCKVPCGSIGRSLTASSGDKPGQKLVASTTANGCMLVCFAGASGSGSASSAVSGSVAGGPTRATDSSAGSALNGLKLNGEECMTAENCVSNYCKLPPGPKTARTRGVCAGNREDGTECVTDSQCISNSCELPAGPKTARTRGKCVAAVAVEAES